MAQTESTPKNLSYQPASQPGEPPSTPASQPANQESQPSSQLASLKHNCNLELSQPAPFSNTCAKYMQLGSTFAVFLEHMCDLAAMPHAFCIRVPRIHRLRKSGNTLASGGPRDFCLQQKRRISRARVQTKVLTDVSYSKPSLFIEEYVISLRHGTACCLFGKSVYFSNTCAKYKYQLAWHIRNHHFPSKNTLYQGHAESQPSSPIEPPGGPPGSQPASQPASQLASQFNTYL